MADDMEQSDLWEWWVFAKAECLCLAAIPPGSDNVLSVTPR